MMKWKKLGKDTFGDYSCNGFKIYKGIKGRRWFLLNADRLIIGEFSTLANAKLYAEKIMDKEEI